MKPSKYVLPQISINKTISENAGYMTQDLKKVQHIEQTVSPFLRASSLFMSN